MVAVFSSSRRRALRTLSIAGMSPGVHAGPMQLPLAMPFPASARPVVQRYLVSEKLDGVRACWDGTQLRFRSGLAVPAPETFLRRLPPVPLDGELWLGRGRFDALSACVRRALPQPDEWSAVRYMVFELPRHPGDFAARYEALRHGVARLGWPQLQAVTQEPVHDIDELERRLRAVVSAGGEGLVLHRADAPYTVGRSEALLKLKPLDDAEATVIGHVPGQGRLRGRVGALVVRDDDGAVFRLGTGLSDALRSAPPPPGTRVTYTYRGLTGGGLPRFASFLRVRNEP